MNCWAVALALLVAAAGLGYLYLKNAYAFFKKRGIPYAEPTLLFGSVNELKALTPPGFFARYLDIFKGGFFGYFLMTKPVLVVGDPELIKTIMTTKFSNFRNKPSQKKGGAMFAHPGLLGMADAQWKRNRSALSPTFSGAKIKQMLILIKDCTQTLVDIVNEKSADKNTVNVNSLFESYTMEVIGITAFGIKIDSQRDPSEKFLVFARKFFKKAKAPALRAPGMPEFDAEVKKIRQFWNSAIEMLFQTRISSAPRKDLLQSMVDRLPKYTNDSTDTGSGTMSKSEVKGNMMTFLLAGYETTSNALSYTTYLLAKYPDIQEKLYEEIREILGDKDTDYDSISSMEYLDQVLKESLRIYPPAYGVRRVCNETCELPGVGQVEEGMTLAVPIYVLHHSPKYWDQPEEFRPERFSKENAADITPFTYLPFGEGQRQCIGMRFALVEAKVALVEILRRFRILTTGETEDPPTLSHGITMTAKNGIKLRFTER